MPNDPAAKAVAAFWGLQPVVLFSWLLHLNTVRNLCAHHCRLFSAALPQAPKYPNNRAAPAVLRAGRWPNPNQPYATFAVLALLLKRCRPEYPFGRLAGELLQGAAPQHLQAMGFPPGWRNEPLFAGW